MPDNARDGSKIVDGRAQSGVAKVLRRAKWSLE
jgi:hypothetical protein